VVEASLTTKTLNRLRESRRVALDNLKFYECLYDDMEDSPDRTSIGQAMAQKQSYIGAVDAILKNHDISVLDTPLNPPANDCADLLGEVEMGDHLAQEERFCNVLLSCMDTSEDELTTQLLSDHLKAAELAVQAIKETSLKI